MDNTVDRKEIIENEELKELLGELKALDTEIVAMVNESEERQKEFNTKTLVRQKTVDKMKPIVNAEFVGKIGDFETLANLVLNEEDQIEVKIVNDLETWKANYKERREEKFKGPETVDEPLAEKTEG